MITDEDPDPDMSVSSTPEPEAAAEVVPAGVPTASLPEPLAELVELFPRFEEGYLLDIVKAVDQALAYRVAPDAAADDSLRDSKAALKPLLDVLGSRNRSRSAFPNPDVQASIYFTLEEDKVSKMEEGEGLFRMKDGEYVKVDHLFSVEPEAVRVIHPETYSEQGVWCCILHLQQWNRATDILTGDRTAGRKVRVATRAGEKKLRVAVDGLAGAFEEAKAVHEALRVHETQEARDRAVQYLAFRNVLSLWEMEARAIRVVEWRDLKVVSDWFDAYALMSALARALARVPDPDALRRSLATKPAFWKWATATAQVAGCRPKSEKAIRRALVSVGIILEGERSRGTEVGAEAWTYRLLSEARRRRW